MPDKKILLVDDDPSILRVLTRFLDRQGYAVAAVATGQEALEAIQGEDFPLAIIDIKLPDISGLELLSHLKTHSPDTEVILFTGLAGLESAIQALRLGAYDYIVKSELRLPELQAVADRALERRRLSRANRELLDNLSQAQEELAARRAAELVQIRRIGEALAGPLTPEQLLGGLLNLIWESLPLVILALEFQEKVGEKTWQSHRCQPDIAPTTSLAYLDWFRQLVHRTRGEGEPEGDGEKAPKQPFTALLWESVQADNVFGLVAAGRQEPFTTEEAELFRIFTLQGEAALKNLLLFEKVKSLAIRDGLTGLYNYRYFWEMLNQQVGQSRRYGWPLSLLFVDIDNFKMINDTLGHPQGDLVLKGLAAYLKREVRQADLLCRYGGEEFVVLLPQTPVEQAMVMAERLRESITRTPMTRSEQELFITISIGVAGLEPGMDGAALVGVADEALYRAKQSGKNRVTGSTEMLVAT